MENHALSVDLDAELTRIKSAPTDCDLGGVERRVWSRIEGQRGRRESLSGLALVRVAAVAAALGAGAVAGGASALDGQILVQEVSVFSPASGLAPSTLLAG